MQILQTLVTVFLVFIIYFFAIANNAQIERFKDNTAIRKKVSNNDLLSRVEALENEFKELSALIGYTLESIDNRVQKNEEKFKKLSLRQRDTQAEIKELNK